MKNRSEYQPFSRDLDGVKYGKIYKFRAENVEKKIKKQLDPHDTKIIRRFADYLPYEKELGDQGISKMIEFIKENEEYFKELREKYNINSPQQSSIIATGEKEYYSGGRIMYTMVDKIEGALLHEIEFKKEDSEEWHRKLDVLYSSLVQYLMDKYSSGERYLSDIFSARQYKYGVKAGDNLKNHKKEIILIDVEPLLNKKDDDKRYPKKYDQEIKCLTAVVAGIVFFEERIGGIKFQMTRNKVEEFLETLNLGDSQVSDSTKDSAGKIIEALKN